MFNGLVSFEGAFTRLQLRRITCSKLAPSCSKHPPTCSKPAPTCSKPVLLWFKPVPTCSQLAPIFSNSVPTCPKPVPICSKLAQPSSSLPQPVPSLFRSVPSLFYLFQAYSNLLAPGSTHKGDGFGPCPWFNGSSDVPTWQSPGIYPNDTAAVDMVNVDQFYDDSVEGFVRGAVADQVPFFFYFASHHTHAPQFAACQTVGGANGDDKNLASTCKTKRGLFGDSLALLDRSVARLHSLLDELFASFFCFFWATFRSRDCRFEPSGIRAP